MWVFHALVPCLREAVSAKAGRLRFATLEHWVEPNLAVGRQSLDKIEKICYHTLFTIGRTLATEERKMNRSLFVIMLLVGAFLTGCASAARFCHEVFVCDNPVAHGHVVVESTGGGEVLFANTGPLADFTQRVIVYDSDRNPLDEFTLDGMCPTFVKWYPEGSYRWASFNVDGKKTRDGKLFVPYQGRTFRYYNRRYAAGVVIGR